MSNRPTPETDAAEAKRRAEWLHKHKAHKDWIILSVSEVAVIRDELLILERERDEALEKIKQQKLEIVRLNGATNYAGGTPLKIALRERAEAREQVKELREALLRVRTWGVSSKNFSATDSYKMAEWIDDGCEGELPKPDGPWIYEKMEETK